MEPVLLLLCFIMNSALQRQFDAEVSKSFGTKKAHAPRHNKCGFLPSFYRLYTFGYILKVILFDDHKLWLYNVRTTASAKRCI